MLHYPWLNTFFECVLFLAGLVFGSFLNVCITRIPREESIIHPASHCRECGKPVRWFDNVPVVSFLLLRGRCRACGTRIPYRYPAVELLTGLVFAACYVWYGPTWLTAKFCLFAFLLIGLIFMDAETGLLPHQFTYTGIVLGLTLSWLLPSDSAGTSFLLLVFRRHIESIRWLSLLDGVLGALVGAGFFYLAWALYYLARKRHGLGFGDIALTAMTGAFLGLKLNLLVIFCAPLVTVVYILALLLYEQIRTPAQTREVPAGSRSAGDTLPSTAEDEDAAYQTNEPAPFLQRELPFGVFLGACALAAIFFGEAAWRWYLARF